MGVQLDHARAHEVVRRVVECETAHVERPQVERRPAFEDPLRHHLAGASAGGDAVEEAGGDEVVVELGNLAHHEVGVGRVGDRPVDHRADAGLLDHRRTSCRERRQLFETVEVRVQQLALERRGDALEAERQGVRLVSADEEPGPVRLVVHEQVRVAHRRHLSQLGGREIGDRARSARTGARPRRRECARRPSGRSPCPTCPRR